MAITIDTSPQDYTGTRNPVYYKLSTDSYEVVAGVAPDITIQIISGSIANGNFFTLTFNGQTVTFTFQSGSTECDEIDWTAWMDENDIMADLKRQRVIYQNFDISYTAPDKFKFTSKHKLSAWDLVFATNNGAAFSQSAITAATDQVNQEGMKIVADIYNSSNELQGTMDAIVDTNGTAEFYLEKILHNLISVIPPTYGMTTALQAKAMVFYYMVRFYELYQNVYCGKQWRVGEVFQGGLNYELWKIDEDWSAYFTISAGRKFFNNIPGYSSVRQDQQFVLYYFIIGSPASINVNLNVTYLDYTTESKAVNLALSDNGMIAIPAGLDQIGGTLTGDVADVATYSIDISYSGHTSETYYFVVDRQPVTQANFFLFQNQLGGMDPVMLLNNAASAPGINSISSVLSRPSEYVTDYNNVPAQLNTKNQNSSIQYIIESGSIGLEEKLQLEKLIASDTILWQGPDRFYPITVTDQKISPSSESDEMYSVKLEFQVAWLND